MRFISMARGEVRAMQALGVEMLSPHEAVTLRRVALGIANLVDLPVRDVERLKSLLLIEEFSAGLRLTPTGKKRYLALPNSAAFDSGAPDEGLAKMAEFISKARG